MNQKKYHQIWTEIKKHHRFLLHLHPGPDGDSVGSALAMYHCLTSIGKKVTLISGDSSFPSNLSFIPGSENITKANFFDLNLSDFDCFICLDSSELTQVSKKQAVIIPPNLFLIVIDHHASNFEYGNLNLVEKYRSSTSEIIYRLFKANKVSITPDIAACLFVGIYTDTGGFKYQYVNSDTFLAGAYLSKIYPDFSSLIFEIENNDSPDRLKMIGIHLKQIKTDKHFAYSWITYKQIQKLKLAEDSSVSSFISNTLKSITGWDICVSFTENSPSSTKASFRTRDSVKYPVGPFVKAMGYGGGHLAAAGALFPFPLAKSIKIVKKSLKKIYPDLL